MCEPDAISGIEQVRPLYFELQRVFCPLSVILLLSIPVCSGKELFFEQKRTAKVQEDFFEIVARMHRLKGELALARCRGRGRGFLDRELGLDDRAEYSRQISTEAKRLINDISETAGVGITERARGWHSFWHLHTVTHWIRVRHLRVCH